LLFSLVDPALFENVRAKWVPEIRQHCPDTPFVLVGTKTDLRSDIDTMQGLADKRLAAITTEQGQEMAQQVGAAMYREISSRQLFEVDGLFHEAVDLVLGPKIRAQRQGRCCVM
jgi:Ras-related C3 botulinum toxin substrate 1